MTTRRPSTGFDLATIDRIEVLPLGLGQAAPNRRKARFNGDMVARKHLNTERTLVWMSPRTFYADREPFTLPRPTRPPGAHIAVDRPDMCATRARHGHQRRTSAVADRTAGRAGVGHNRPPERPRCVHSIASSDQND